jgi:hypothetical protein
MPRCQEALEDVRLGSREVRVQYAMMARVEVTSPITVTVQ